MTLLHQAFEHAAADAPDKVAVVCGDRRISYGDLRDAVNALANQLTSLGVASGDRVLVVLDSSIAYVVAVHAVLAAGAVLVPVSATVKSERLAFLLHDTRARAIVTQASHAPMVGLIARSASSARTIVVDGAPRAATSTVQSWAWPRAGEAVPTTTHTSIRDDQLAALIYTSGTTGRPKGVMLSHRNMVSAWHAVQTYLQLRHDDVLLLALPPTYSYGLYNLLMTLGVGATLVLEPRAAFPAKVLETLQAARATVLPGVPTLLAALLGLEHFARSELDALRLVTNAAAAWPVAHIEALRRALPRVSLLSMYGLSECKRASYLPPDQIANRPDSVGRGLPGQEHWLVDDDGRRVPMGGMGELVVRGPHVMQGYWERPDESARALRPGPADGLYPGARALYTGDLFRSDAEGYLYFIGRRDDMIKTRGEKVAPREVEDVIYRLPAVAGCAVVGVPDAALGQAVKAFVTLRAGDRLDARQIIRHCQQHLESFMVPRLVELVDELPRTESGKIRHASLRAAPPAATASQDQSETA